MSCRIPVAAVACWHPESIPAARCNPDHTADIRQRLIDMAMRGALGLGVARRWHGASSHWSARSAAGPPSYSLAALWIVDAALGGTAAPSLWMIYRRRRASLDA